MNALKAWDLMERIEANGSNQMITIFEKGDIRIALDNSRGTFRLVFENTDTEIGVVAIDNVYEMEAILRAADILIPAA